MFLRRFIFTVVVTSVLLVLVMFGLGVLRYGSADALIRRVRIEIASRAPRDPYVPTPLPLEGEAAAAPTRPPTLTPVPTATPIQGAEAGAEGSAPAPAQATVAPENGAAPLHRPARPSVQLTNFQHEWQTWNNCAPATLAMYLSHYGCQEDQHSIGDVLRPNKDDKHVGTDELVDFARRQGYSALLRVNGNRDLLRLLLSNELAVMVPSWHEDEPGDGLGHYRLLVGYDDAGQEWLIYDSLAGKGTDLEAPYSPNVLTYEQFAEWWAVFNRTYILVYPPEMQPLVESILGPQMNDEVMWQEALARSEREVQEDPTNAHAWFNLGTNLLAQARYDEAARAYDRARVEGLPWRMLWYQFGPFEAYYGAGRYRELLALAEATLDTTSQLEEVHYWRGMALSAVGELQRARESLERAVSLRPNYPQAHAALQLLSEEAGGE